MERTVKEVYSGYYNEETVSFFLMIHSEKNICEDVQKGLVYLVEKDGKTVGTGSLKEDKITRVYILPEEEGKGAGSFIMDFLEKKAGEKYKKVSLDPSEKAVSFYEKRGYYKVSHNVCTLPEGTELNHDVYEKIL